MIKKFISYYKPYRGLFFADLLVATIATLCNLIYPMMTRTLVNDAIPNKQIKVIGIFAIVLMVLYLIKAGCCYFMQYFGHLVGVRMQGDMRRDMFEHLEKLPNSYFDNTKTGDLMSRMINDLMEVSELAHHGPEDLFISGVMLIGSFFILLNINVFLTLIIFAILPLLIWFAVAQRKRMNKAFMETRVKTGDVNATLENSIAGMKVTKSFCNEHEELKKFNRSNGVFKVARESAYKVMADYFSGMNLFMDVLELIALIAGGYFAYIGKISLGDFTAYLLYVKMFIEPIKKLINFTEQYQSGMTGFERFMEIVNEDTEKEVENPIELKDVKGNINIENISFTYEDKKEVLKGLNLNIEAGKTVALVGPSGGGKTTLCNLIPRFYDFNEGDIKIDGISVKEVSLKSLRKNIGVVQQDVFLFTGTIKENILCAKLDASDDEIIDAAKKAKIHDFIQSLPKGYETYIGERGVKLSGGQKQRISICRVFLKNPPIIILDEATSALDNVTEREIQKSLEELSKDRTNLVIAHRLSTIKNADEIIVLTDSGIVERGNHEELIVVEFIVNYT